MADAACTAWHRIACSRVGIRSRRSGRCTPAIAAFPHLHTPVMRPSIPLALLVGIGSPRGAQGGSGRIEGQVFDSVHAAPLVNAAVSATRVGAASDTTVVVRTDGRGRFRFDAIEAGRYALRFTSP